MTSQRIRRAAAALVLAATLALAAPAHAAGWKDLGAHPRWIETALEWIAHLWVGGGEATGLTPGMEKCGAGSDPDGNCHGAVAPPPSTGSSAGGTDPEG